MTPTPTAMKPRNVAGRLATRRVTGSVDSGPAGDLGAGLVKIALPEVDVRGLLQLAIVVPAQIDDDDVPVPEIRLHVGGESRFQKILVGAPGPVLIERRRVLEHVGDEDQGLLAPVVDLLGARDELQGLEDRRLLADLGGEAFL